MRRARRLSPAALAAAVALAVLASPHAVSAHPLGNFTINHYSGIRVAPEAVLVDHVIDMAEIPTFTERRTIDSNADGTISAPELDAYAGSACDRQVRSLALEANDARVPLGSTRVAASLVPGQGGLDTLRLECRFEAPLAAAGGSVALAFRDGSYRERLGWREIVVEGDGIALRETDALRLGRSNRLQAYPDDLLERPLDMSTAVAWFDGPAPRLSGATAPDLPDAGPLARVPGAELGPIRDLVAAPALTPAVVAAAVAIAVLLGGYHALTPGHGKTVMAAYLVGTRGRARDAVVLGLAVTVAHTLGVLVLGVVVLASSSVVSPETLYPWLTVISGATMAVIGARLLWLRLGDVLADRRDRRAHEHGHGHVHQHGHGDAHDHAHGHVHDHNNPLGTWRSLVALGLSGGLVPSASALLLLLGSVGLGRPLFGVVLIVAFGAGMAAILSGLGLLLVRGQAAVVAGIRRARAARWQRRVRLVGFVPGVVVLVAGAAITLGAARGLV